MKTKIWTTNAGREIVIEARPCCEAMGKEIDLRRSNVESVGINKWHISVNREYAYCPHCGTKDPLIFELEQTWGNLTHEID